MPRWTLVLLRHARRGRVRKSRSKSQNHNWTAKIEYLYFDLGTVTTIPAPTPGTTTAVAFNSPHHRQHPARRRQLQVRPERTMGRLLIGPPLSGRMNVRERPPSRARSADSATRWS